MKVRDPTLWMWGEALELLARADRLQRQFCQLGPTRSSSPSWEPPVDVFETASELVIVVALPGVSPQMLGIEVAPGTIVVQGQRRQPPAAVTGHIHRLELPYGRFERRIELPATGQLQLAGHVLADGCLTLTLNKLGTPP